MGKKRIIKKNDIKDKKKDNGSGAASSVAKSKISKNIKEGMVYIFSSYNNTIINLSDTHGNILFWSTAGKIGFSGAKKCTPFAASKVAEVVAQVIEASGIEKIGITVKGIGPGRDSAVRSFAAKGINIVSIKDVTPVPHNGCRPKKPRRI
ncbi:30S ribosomal protein S11 [Candidatus Parcubacteria bacterium A4]|nr:MAG: 30S ribosomal protein S11 [Candidatus Parcubacteria bacterium A4]